VRDDRHGDRQLDCHGTSRDRAALDGLRWRRQWAYRRWMGAMRSVGSWDASPTDGTAGRQGTRCAFDVHSSFRLYENNDGPPIIIHLIYFTWINRFYFIVVFLVGATPTLSVFDDVCSKPVSSDFHHVLSVRVTSRLRGGLC